MTILYAIIARRQTVLAEETQSTGNFVQIARVLLGKISADDGKMTYVYDNSYVFHYLVDDGVVYMCMVDDAQNGKRRIPFAFLETIKERFKSMYGDAIQTAIHFAMDKEFGPTLKAQMLHYNGPNADQMSEVNQKMDDVKNVMVQNIEMVLERGEKLELLVDKTEQLQSSADTFKFTSNKLKNVMFWKTVKFYAMVAALVAFVIIVISMIACGVDYSQCQSDDDATEPPREVPSRRCRPGSHVAQGPLAAKGGRVGLVR
eukprot:CAMPEP_0182558088 /NCGR_PEP_ID=MMETSP1324-20130603/1784_1 /TAXON_ID=236786 /ORGANISM="Florenciella sp., Strain RCC1587" /LENGTH=258 /DNA_ID=CAMNT_0024770247 /DNA_START=86 /DNA_END=863 /DNA_ORIENTATION=+